MRRPGGQEEFFGRIFDKAVNPGRHTLGIGQLMGLAVGFPVGVLRIGGVQSGNSLDEERGDSRIHFDIVPLANRLTADG